MAEEKIRIVLPYTVSKVWEILTDVRNYGWRSDVNHARVINENQFIEIDQEGIRTVCTVTDYEIEKKWELDLDNDNIHGHWTAILEAEGLHTNLTIIKEVMAKKLLLKPLLGANLKKQMHIYAEDLKRVLKYQ
jgi:hypothetical protein